SSQRDITLELTTPDDHWYDTRMKTLRNWRNEPLGRVIVLRDITGLKRSEDERARLEGQLRQAQKMEAIGQLAGGIAHDFKNLLTPIIWHAELAQMQLAPGEAILRNIQSILEAAQRAADITRQLTAFSKEQTLTMDVVDPAEIIHAFLPILRSMCGGIVTVKSELDPAAGYIKADKTQIEQVLMNLLINARDAMPTGGEARITVANAMPDEAMLRDCPTLAPGPCVMISVSDTGEGMDMQTQEHIFEPFFTTKKLGKGTGLGLAVVFGIVKQHQGHITVDSAPGCGTTIRIMLPSVESPVDILESLPPLVDARQTILLAEDEEMVRTLVAEALHLQGFDVLVAADGDEALSLAHDYNGSINLLVTDIVMPRMNGNALYHQLINLYPECKALFMSGYPGDTFTQQDFNEQSQLFLAKPFTIPRLLEKVNTALTMS
ncbi:MAG TPA: ATP-binding protein, partial [Armatimonadota bacterium]